MKPEFIKTILVSGALLLSSGLSVAYTPSGGLTYIGLRDDVATPGIDESQQGCVYREANGEWVVDDCDFVGAHNACL